MTGTVGGIAGARLKSFVERIERLEEEKRNITTDIKEVYAEAKGTGFDTKIMRQVIRERRMDKDDLDEQEALLDVYRRALGMLADTPLGRASEPKSRKAPTTFVDKSVPPESESVIEKTVADLKTGKSRATKKFVDAIVRNDGESVSLTIPGKGGVKISNRGGEKIVEPIGTIA